jgi:hypothetical protein
MTLAEVKALWAADIALGQAADQSHLERLASLFAESKNVTRVIATVEKPVAA